MFNSFSDTYLRIFQSCFPIKQKPIHHNHKPWLTQGIRISCANKKKLYETYKYSKEPNFKIYYKKYCKILTSTIEVSKRKYYDNLISKSTNKTKTIWNLVKTITNKSKIRNTIASMNTNNHSINDPDTILILSTPSLHLLLKIFFMNSQVITSHRTLYETSTLTF